MLCTRKQNLWVFFEENSLIRGRFAAHFAESFPIINIKLGATVAAMFLTERRRFRCGFGHFWRRPASHRKIPPTRIHIAQWRDDDGIPSELRRSNNLGSNGSHLISISLPVYASWSARLHDKRHTKKCCVSQQTTRQWLIRLLDLLTDYSAWQINRL